VKIQWSLEKNKFEYLFLKIIIDRPEPSDLADLASGSESCGQERKNHNAKSYYQQF